MIMTKRAEIGSCLSIPVSNIKPVCNQKPYVIAGISDNTAIRAKIIGCRFRITDA